MKDRGRMEVRNAEFGMRNLSVVGGQLMRTPIGVGCWSSGFSLGGLTVVVHDNVPNWEWSVCNRTFHPTSAQAKA